MRLTIDFSARRTHKVKTGSELDTSEFVARVLIIRQARGYLNTLKQSFESTYDYFLSLTIESIP